MPMTLSGVLTVAEATPSTPPFSAARKSSGRLVRNTETRQCASAPGQNAAFTHFIHPGHVTGERKERSLVVTNRNKRW